MAGFPNILFQIKYLPSPLLESFLSKLTFSYIFFVYRFLLNSDNWRIPIYHHNCPVSKHGQHLFLNSSEEYYFQIIIFMLVVYSLFCLIHIRYTEEYIWIQGVSGNCLVQEKIPYLVILGEIWGNGLGWELFSTQRHWSKI